MFNNSDGSSTILTDAQQFCPTLNNSDEKIVEPLNAQPLNKSDGYRHEPDGQLSNYLMSSAQRGSTDAKELSSGKGAIRTGKQKV